MRAFKMISKSEYIIEFRQYGELIKVSAVDSTTLKEVTLAFPAGKGLSKEDMKRAAIKKLEFVLAKQ